MILLFCSFTGAQENSARSRVEHYLDFVLKGDAHLAVDLMASDDPVLKNNTKQIKAVKAQLETVYKIYGKPYGYEMISEEKLSPSLVRLVYLTKHMTHPVIWEFYLYKPENKWVLSQFVFEDSFRLLGPEK